MKYNPGFFEDHELVARFTVRLAELDELLQFYREPPGSTNTHHMIVAPRGYGKTMLVRRVAAELRSNAELAQTWLPVTFGEEAYEVLSAAEFWLEALLHMATATGDDSWVARWEDLRHERDDERLQYRALAALRTYAERRGVRLVLIVENMDQLFEQFGEEDEFALRKVWMSDAVFAVLGTTVSTFRGIDDPDHANYDLFLVRNLPPLSEPEIDVLWTSVRGESIGLRRARAIRILTGGNARLVAVMASFASGVSLRNLLGNLARLLDDRASDFKHSVEAIKAGPKRKTFLALADLWDPSTSGEVAAAARLDLREVSVHLGRLEREGRVEVVGQRGRAKLYQVRERLYNLYYLMRRRGGAADRVRAIVAFMVDFYEPTELPRVLVRMRGDEAEARRREQWMVPEERSAPLTLPLLIDIVDGRTADPASVLVPLLDDDALVRQFGGVLLLALLTACVADPDGVETVLARSRSGDRFEPVLVALRQRRGLMEPVATEVQAVADDITTTLASGGDSLVRDLTFDASLTVA